MLSLASCRFRRDAGHRDHKLLDFSVLAYYMAMQNLAIKPPVPRQMPITVEIYHLMAERGAFHPDDRVELVGGKLFDMSPIGSLHARCVKFLNHFLSNKLGNEAIISVQDPIILDDESEPQPDIAVLNFRDDYYKSELPSAADVRLLIEVADTSVEFDRTVKFERYAATGVPESWLIDLLNDRVEVHFAPQGSAYSRANIYQRGENAVSQTISVISIPVDDILG